mgnify:FL=1
MGKGSGRLHDRTQAKPSEMERRWEQTFQKKGEGEGEPSDKKGTGKDS